MKILFISNPAFFDMDLSLIKHLSERCDVHYLLDLPSYALKSSALEIRKQKSEAKILSADEYEELNRFEKFINFKKFSIINRPSKKSYSWSNIKLQYKILKFVTRINPDIIHCNNFINLNFLFLLLKCKSKIILTVHDPFPHSGEISFRKKNKRQLNFIFIKNIILLNLYQKDEFVLKNRRYHFKNVFISSLGVYEYLNDYNIELSESSKFIILFFGRISPYKGIDVLLEAFLSIEKSFPNIKLIIAGSGNFYFDTSLFQSNPKIKFINRYITNEELVNLIYQSAIVVCPYKDATQSGVVMSAYALNKPVLATNVGGLPEMIDDSKTGYLIPPNNSNAIAEKITQIIQSDAILKIMEENIKKEYNDGDKSWSKIAKELVSFYSICSISHNG